MRFRLLSRPVVFLFLSIMTPGRLPPTQIEEKTPASVRHVKKEAAAAVEKLAEKAEKVATPVLEAVAPKRVSFCNLGNPCLAQVCSEVMTQHLWSSAQFSACALTAADMRRLHLRGLIQAKAWHGKNMQSDHAFV